jgi:hypothetical protein
VLVHCKKNESHCIAEVHFFVSECVFCFGLFNGSHVVFVLGCGMSRICSERFNFIGDSPTALVETESNPTRCNRDKELRGAEAENWRE